jgi:Protein of unknown function (DUF2846)
MPLWARPLVAAFVCLMLAACAATTTALESQKKPQGAHTARIYIFRPGGWSYSARTANVKIDGQDVGELANESYLFVDRPPGKHTIGLRMPLDFTATEHDVQVAAGRTYYFALNMRSLTMVGGGAVMTIAEPKTGQTVQQRNFMSSTYLAEIDAATGAALLAKLKAP